MSDSPVSARRPKRVAIVATLASSLINFRGQLIADMVARGHDVLCFAPDFDAETRDALEAQGVLCHEIPLNRRGLSPLADLKTIRELTRLFKGYAPDVFFGYTPKAAIYGTIAAARARVPTRVPMITGLGYTFTERDDGKTRLRSLLTKLYRYATKRSTCVIFQNEDDAKILHALGGISPRSQVEIVNGSGVDLERFATSPMPSTSGAITFLLVARLVTYKGVGEYCAAARKIVEAGYNARFELVGPAETGASGISEQSIAAFSDVVTYHGSQKDVLPFIAHAHVLVLPSHGGEGLPRTVLEAMAVGRAIITTNTNGCRETVDELVNGILVPPRDANALADAMVRMIEKRDLLPTLGKASRDKVERRFDVRIINANMLRHLTLD